jgi:hypothetical protein
MLAAHRHDVELLNQLARTRMHDAGLLTGPELETRWGDVFQVGDRIVVRENWYRHHDLRNGQTGTITHLNPAAGSLTFRRDHDQAEITLPRRYLEASVDYGYAQTIHTAQGHTYQQAHLYLDAAVGAEHGYTGLSRARDETHLWIADMPGPSGGCTHHYSQPLVEGRIEVLVRQLTRTGVEPPATDHDVKVRTATDRQLIEWRDDLARTLRASPLASDPSDELAALEAAIDEAREVAQRWRTSGTRAQVQMLESERDAPNQYPAVREAWLEDNAHLIHQYSDVVDELDRRITARTLLYQHDPPDDLVVVLGPRPTGTETHKWNAAVEVYARARLHAGPDADLTDPALLQGPQWRDIIYQAHPIEQRAPVLRLTG